MDLDRSGTMPRFPHRRGTHLKVRHLIKWRRYKDVVRHLMKWRRYTHGYGVDMI